MSVSVSNCWLYFYITVSISLIPTLYLVEVVQAPSGDATTTLYLEATDHSLYPLGILTSIVDTFINGGTTTEYMTQHVGSKVDNVYAKIQTTSSREYYRINPTSSLNIGPSSLASKLPRNGAWDSGSGLGGPRLGGPPAR